MSQTLFDIYERQAPSLDAGADLEANSEAPSLLGAAFRYSLATNFTAWGMRKAGDMLGDEEKISVEDLNEKFNFKSDRPLTRSQLNYRVRVNELDQKFQEAYSQTDGSFDDKAAALGGGLIGGFLDPAAIVFSLGAGALVSGGLKAVGAARTLGILKNGNLPSKIAARAGIYGSVEAGVNMEIGSKVAESQGREYTIFDRFADAAFGVIFGTLFPIGLDSPKKPRPTPNKDKLIKDMLNKSEKRGEADNFKLTEAPVEGSTKPPFSIDEFFGKDPNRPPVFKVDDDYMSLDYMRAYLKDNITLKKGDEFTIDFYSTIEQTTGMSKKEWLMKNQGLDETSAIQLISALDILEEFPSMWNAAVHGSPKFLEYLRKSFALGAEDTTVIENVNKVLSDPRLSNPGKLFTDEEFIEVLNDSNKLGFNKMDTNKAKTPNTKTKYVPEEAKPLTEQEVKEHIARLKKIKERVEAQPKDPVEEARSAKVRADYEKEYKERLAKNLAKRKAENKRLDEASRKYAKELAERTFPNAKNQKSLKQSSQDLKDSRPFRRAARHAENERASKRIEKEVKDFLEHEKATTDKFTLKKKREARRKRVQKLIDALEKNIVESDKPKKPKLTIVKDKK